MAALPVDLSPQSLSPLLAHVAGLDLSLPDSARASLEEAFPVGGPWVSALRSRMLEAEADGSICNRGKMPVRWSRVFKASAETSDLSADAVLMDGPGPLHEHPNGEVDLCFSLDGEPRFDGAAEGWVVYGPGSRHVPTVSGGRMLILYLLPEGAMAFL